MQNYLILGHYKVNSNIYKQMLAADLVMTPFDCQRHGFKPPIQTLLN